MEELINSIIKNISNINANIERNKKYHDYPFTNNCDHFYKLNQLQKQKDCWEEFLLLVNSFKNKRYVTFEKSSAVFKNILHNERNRMPGFYTNKTVDEMIEYMLKLEWRIEELGGAWRT